MHQLIRSKEQRETATHVALQIDPLRTQHNRFTTGLTVMLVALGISFVAVSPATADDDAKPAAKKLDLLERHAKEYATPDKPTIIDIGKAQYLAIDGKGAPEDPVFGESVGAVYGVAYSLKMMSSQAGKDYNVAPLEALWWGSEDAGSFVSQPHETWNWTVLIRTPDFITEEQVRKVVASGMTGGIKVRLESITEGRCVQLLHKGPYADEPATIAVMAAFAEKNGLVANGHHHEIYLTDPNRTAPDKMRTILRQPIKAK